MSLIPHYSIGNLSATGKSIPVTIASMPKSVEEKLTEAMNPQYTFDDIKGKNTDMNAVKENLTLPTAPPTAVEGVTLRWIATPANNGCVNISTGEVTRPTFEEEDKKIILTPVYATEGIERAGEAIEITIAKRPLEESTADVQDAYAINESDLVSSGDTINAVNGNFKLPQTGENGSKITWSSDPMIVNPKTGKVLWLEIPAPFIGTSEARLHGQKKRSNRIPI